MEVSMQDEYITTRQLAERINYDERTIRESWKDSVLLEGVHYIRPFGGRKILFLWSAIERDMVAWSKERSIGIPMANGGACHE
jgi:hypothetical protein